MKKLTLTIITLIFFSLNSKAQEIANNTIGISVNSLFFEAVGLSYQAKISDKSRLEFNLGTDFDDYGMSGMYERVIMLADKINWYVGGGIGFGTGRSKFSGLSTVGIEYNFESPILLSVETFPLIVNDDGLGYGGVNFTVRYQF